MFIPDNPLPGTKFSAYKEKVCKALAKNDGYCPCVSERNDDTFCPCTNYKNTLICHCNLYIKE